MLARSRAVIKAFPVAFSAPSALPKRMMSERFKKEESAAEKDFINRQERELLKRLIKRVAPETEKGADDSLATILNKHKVVSTPALIEDLTAWRNEH